MTANNCIVHVIDDDNSWRTSVQRLMSAIGYRVTLYESAEAFLKTAILSLPGCVLLDVRMPGLSGPQLQQRLVDMGATLPIIFISGHGDIPTSVRAMKSGAEDFLTKPVPTEALVAAVAQAIARDGKDRVIREQLDVMHSRVDTLTPTERKVLALVVRGMLNKNIAGELGTAERTVKWHRHNIMEKLQVQSLAELVSMVERLGAVGVKVNTNHKSR